MSSDPAPDATNTAADSAAAPALDFTTIALSLHESALILLGIKADANGMQTDLDGARYQIDMLGVLAEKTKGNLTEDEDRLLRTVLYELRVAYTERVR